MLLLRYIVHVCPPASVVISNILVQSSIFLGLDLCNTLLTAFPTASLNPLYSPTIHFTAKSQSDVLKAVRHVSYNQ